MKTFFALYLVFFSVLTSAQSLDTIEQFDYKIHFEIIQKEVKKSSSKYYYNTQLQKFLNNEEQSDLEVLSMLIGYTNNEKYSPYRSVFTGQDMFDLNEEGKYLEAYEIGEKIMKNNPFLIKVLREMAYCSKALGKPDTTANYNTMITKIYKAMRFSSISGGTDSKNAIFALNPRDGQYYIKYYLKCKIGDMGSGYNEDGYFVDILEKIDNEGKSVRLYFNCEHAIATMKAAMEKN